MTLFRQSLRLPLATGALVAALLVVLALAGCADGDGETKPSAPPATAADPATMGSSAGTSSAPTSSQTPTTPIGGGDVGGGSGDPPDDGAVDPGISGTDPGNPGATGGGVTVEAALAYSNPDHGIEFSYPADWRLTDDISARGTAGSSAVDSVGVFDPRGTQKNGILLDGIVVSVYQLPARVDESLMPVFRDQIAAILPQLEERLNDFLVVDPLRPTSVNGLPGFETSYTFTQNGQELRSRMLFLVAGDIEYQLTVQSAASVWDGLQPSFDVTLSTFRSTG